MDRKQIETDPFARRHCMWVLTMQRASKAKKHIHPRQPIQLDNLPHRQLHANKQHGHPVQLLATSKPNNPTILNLKTKILQSNNKNPWIIKEDQS